MSLADAQRIMTIESKVADIDVAALIDRLQAHVLADAPGTMTDAEVAVDIALLDRLMTDLHLIELTARSGRPIRSALASARASKIEGG
jgi:hypothetical protein